MFLVRTVVVLSCIWPVTLNTENTENYQQGGQQHLKEELPLNVMLLANLHSMNVSFREGFVFQIGRNAKERCSPIRPLPGTRHSKRGKMGKCPQFFLLSIPPCREILLIWVAGIVKFGLYRLKLVVITQQRKSANLINKQDWHWYSALVAEICGTARLIQIHLQLGFDNNPQTDWPG